MILVKATAVTCGHTAFDAYVLLSTSGNTMAIVPAEAPESSSHTGNRALVAQPHSDAPPAWFSGFMQMQQHSTQTLDDKLSQMVNNQQRTLDVVQNMQVNTGAVCIHHMSTICISVHACVAEQTILCKRMHLVEERSYVGQVSSKLR